MTHALERQPAVAGRFYPAEGDVLQRQVEGYLAESGVTPAPERVAAVVGPHAGIMFSGPTAAYAYARVAGHSIERVILLGCSHHYRFDGASIVTAGAFHTPLGTLPVDETFAPALAERVGTGSVEPHLPEHSLEMHLPFIQVAIGDVPIVPVLFGSDGSDWHCAFGDTLAEMVGPHDLVAISTDLSHYYSEGEANRLDKASLDILLSQDVKGYLAADEDARSFMCGATAVATGMEYALKRQAHDWQVLDYRTSAAASGDRAHVVGYAAVSMERAA